VISAVISIRSRCGDHDRAAEADEPAEQVADDGAVVLRAITAPV
jgi:hypothetical protein